MALSLVKVATKADALIIDNGIPGVVDPGDTVRYTAVITNSGNQDASTVDFTDLLADANLALVVGTVITSQGSVTTGNTEIYLRWPTLSSVA